MNIADVLQGIVWYDHRNGITVKELADATKTHERTVYFYLNGERAPGLEWLVAASRYMIESYGDTRIAALFLPADAVVMRAGDHETNGSIADEFVTMSIAEGELLSAVRARNFGHAGMILEGLMTAAAQMKSEIVAMEARA